MMTLSHCKSVDHIELIRNDDCDVICTDCVSDCNLSDDIVVSLLCDVLESTSEIRVLDLPGK